MPSVYGQNSVELTEIGRLQELEKKPLLFFIHTDWCSYCQLMKRTTFKNTEIQRALKDFHLVFLNAEDKRTVDFGGKTFRFETTGVNSGTHALARSLGTIEGELSFPAICILGGRNGIIYQHKGYLSAGQLLDILKIVRMSL